MVRDGRAAAELWACVGTFRGKGGRSVGLEGLFLGEMIGDEVYMQKGVIICMERESHAIQPVQMEKNKKMEA